MKENIGGLHVQRTMSKLHGRNYLCWVPFLVNYNTDVDVNALKPCDVLFIIMVHSCFVALKFKQ
jgi:hypothetical protein